MTDNDFRDLVQRSLDGDLSPEESRLLQERMAADPALRRMHVEIAGVTRSLSRVLPLPAPPGLQPAVMRTIERPAPAAAARRGVMARALDLLRSPVGWRPAYAFAGGLALGVLLVGGAALVVTPGSLRPDDAAATMVSGASPMQKVEELRVAVDDLRGWILTESAGDQKSMTLRLESPTALVALVRYDPGLVALGGIRPHGSGGSVLFRDGEVEFRGVDLQFDLLLAVERRPAPPLRLAVSADGRLLYQREIVLERGDPR